MDGSNVTMLSQLRRHYHNHILSIIPTSSSLTAPPSYNFLSFLGCSKIPFNSMAEENPQAWCNWEPSSMSSFQSYQLHPYQVEHHAQVHEREHMFEKMLTPSDVGKLNRLVIPKQHAEKYFPLDAASGGESSGEKGLLLSFEDESGKCWRFRYSYWTSSQSYVFTKGWSRFVKEKRLDAGDFVLFGRLGARRDRLFICCRRRTNQGLPVSSGAMAVPKVTGQWSSACYTPMSPSGAREYPSSGDRGDGVAKSVEVAPANGKRLRLFGVNLDFESETAAPCLSSSSWLSDRDLGQFMASSATSP